MTLNITHDPKRISWIDSANDPAADFPLQNLPFGVFRTSAADAPRMGVAIGDRILDLQAAAGSDLLPEVARPACRQTTLNRLMAGGAAVWSPLRSRISELLGVDSCPAGQLREKVAGCLRPMSGVEMLLPAAIGDYTDFYASAYHATNVGSMFRPDNPLLPNYKWVPIGYHGRASSIIASGSAIRRPLGQVKPPEAAAPAYVASRSLDYELELGAFVGPGVQLGETIPIAAAGSHLFGVVLLNDWSARDIQAWEYQPLGPFLAKNFATTLSPWVVTTEALAPFRVPAMPRPAGDPQPLAYLSDPADAAHGGFEIQLEVLIATARMRADNLGPQRLSKGNFREMYWTFAQMLAHHASNGCNLKPGDLLGSGTVSGPEKESRGCLLELTWRGKEPVMLRTGEQRRFLDDGDEVILRAWCERPGARRIGFGECRGTIQPATPRADAGPAGNP